MGDFMDRSGSGREVSGDFLQLLGRNRLPSAPSASAEAPAGSTHGTTVLAFHWAEGVLMAGDQRATAGSLIVADEVEKVLDLDETSLVAIAGVPATAFEMVRVLQTSFEYYRRSQLQPLSLAAKVRALARLLRENLPMTLQGVGVVVPLLAGLDPLDPSARPEIHFYDPLGAQFQAARFAASGSGSVTIRGLLRYHERFSEPAPSRMNRVEAIQFSLRCLQVAAEFDSATAGVDPARGRFATVRLLTRDGIAHVTPGEQGEALGA